jgi:hypothetical protein
VVGQLGEALRVSDRFRQRLSRPCVGDALMGTVLVAERLEFAERTADGSGSRSATQSFSDATAA